MQTTTHGLIDTIYGNLVFESLMQRSADEALNIYGLTAKSVEIDPERKWIEFSSIPT